MGGCLMDLVMQLHDGSCRLRFKLVNIYCTLIIFPTKMFSKCITEKVLFIKKQFFIEKGKEGKQREAGTKRSAKERKGCY